MVCIFQLCPASVIRHRCWKDVHKEHTCASLLIAPHSCTCIFGVHWDRFLGQGQEDGDKEAQSAEMRRTRYYASSSLANIILRWWVKVKGTNLALWLAGLFFFFCFLAGWLFVSVLLLPPAVIREYCSTTGPTHEASPAFWPYFDMVFLTYHLIRLLFKS